MTDSLHSDGIGVINICDCEAFLSAELLFDCRAARPSLATLWPPDGRMVDVAIEGINFNNGRYLGGLRIDRILQDESPGVDDTDPCPDAIVTGASFQTAQLRAERSSSGDGRVYTILFTVTDAGADICQGRVKVCVPLTEGGQCIDNGARFDSTVCGAPQVDLAVAQEDSPDPVTVGQNLTYRVAVSNRGPSPATGIRLIDYLSETQNILSLTVSQGSYSTSGNTITWDLGTLDLALQATMTVIVSPLEAGTITNTVTVTANEPDLDTSNNMAAETTAVVESAPREADLSITKIDSQDPVVRGTEIAYTMRVTNNGPDTANNVVITDPLPSGVQFISASNRCNRSPNGPIECNLGTLTAGASASVFIRLAPTTTGTITNIAKVSANETDPQELNNTAIEMTTVNAPVADLSVTKTDSPDPVVVNELLTYTIMVMNNGPDSATNVALTDTLPPGVAIVNIVRDGTTSCRQSAAGDSVSCSFFGSMASGSSSIVQLIVRPSATGAITNTASVTANESDPDASNNTAIQSTTVSQPSPTADLSITKADSPDPAFVNRPLNYTITVTNNGLNTATGVFVTDTLPSSVTLSSFPFSCSRSSMGNSLTCAFGLLANGQTVVIPITVIPTAAGTITNTATVTAAEIDPDTANNTATQATTVNPEPITADLSVTMTDSPDPVSVGQPLLYTITVRNNGPDAATNVRLIDQWPLNFPVIRIQTSQGSFSHIDGAFVFELGTLAVGAEATITMEVNPPAAGTFTNRAFVIATESDPNTANNSASATTTINP